MNENTGGRMRRYLALVNTSISRLDEFYLERPVLRTNTQMLAARLLARSRRNCHNSSDLCGCASGIEGSTAHYMLYYIINMNKSLQHTPQTIDTFFKNIKTIPRL